jgi:hypothetical protein
MPTTAQVADYCFFQSNFSHSPIGLKDARKIPKTVGELRGKARLPLAHLIQEKECLGFRNSHPGFEQCPWLRSTCWHATNTSVLTTVFECMLCAEPPFALNLKASLVVPIQLTAFSNWDLSGSNC